MKILIAANAFKNSLDAAAVTVAIKEGLVKSNSNYECNCFPIGDGGDGTGHLIVNNLGGHFEEALVNDPLGRKISAAFGWIENSKTAVIEMADASGLRLLNYSELNPLIANSYGTGEQMKIAIERGARRIIIGMGGSATVDGGCGILMALGARFLDNEGKELLNIPEALKELHSIETAGMIPGLANCEVIILCDVDNKLLGEAGAASIFGPQKGATPGMVPVLDACLTQFALVAYEHTGRDMASIPSGGTAGGAAAGLYALLNARLVNGIDYFLELTNFEDALLQTNVVITGEGSIDEQTLQGKGPFGVAYHAKQKGLPVIGIAGMVPLDINNKLHEYFDLLLPISHKPMNIAGALQNTAKNLERTGFEVGKFLGILTSYATKKEFCEYWQKKDFS